MSSVIASSAGPIPKKLPALPVIQHPALRRPTAEVNELQIQGTSGQNGSHYSAGKGDEGPLPPLRSTWQPKQKPREHSRVLTWPMGQGKTKLDSKPAWTLSQHKMSPEELEDLIQEKLSTGFHGLRQAFKSNDPMGRGNVSREAFTTIMYHLCGFLSAPQINGLLKRLGLDAQSNISFDDFISHFKEVEVVKKEWVDPVVRPSQEATNTANLPANRLRTKHREIAAMRKEAAVHHRRKEAPKYYTAIQVFPLLKKKSRGRNVDLHTILPPSCFDVDGMILKPQLRTALQLLNIDMYEEEFEKVWDRLDASGLGAVDSVTFFNCLGIDPFRERKRRKSRKAVVNSGGPKINGTASQEQEADNTIRKDGEEYGAEKQQDIDSQNLVKLLSDKLAGGYSRLLKSFGKFDLKDTGKVSKEEFLQVLSEYRLQLSVAELENLLTRCGLRDADRLPYKGFLDAFLDRSEGGILKNVLEDPRHRFNRSRESAIGDTTAADAEARLLELFQADFLSLLAAFRNFDRDNLGVVKRYQFKELLESRLGVGLTEIQLSTLLRNMGVAQDNGLVPYPAFLELFTASRHPPKSAACANSPHVVRPSTSPAQSAAQVDSPRSAGVTKNLERCATQVGIKKAESPPRSYEVLIAKLADLLTEKFHLINKTFMGLEQPKKGHLTKQKFQRLFDRHGLTLTPIELDFVWAKLPRQKGDQITFLSLVEHCFLAAGKVTVSDLENGTGSVSQVLQDYAKAMFRKSLDTHTEELEMEASDGDRSPRKPPEEPKELAKASEVEASPPCTKRFDKNDIEAALGRIKLEVGSHWAELKEELRAADQGGVDTMGSSDFKAILKRHCKNISDDDMDCLVAKYDRKRNGRLFYKEFLNSYLPMLRIRSPELPQYKSQTHIAWSEGRRSEEAFKSIVQKIKSQMITDWKDLRRTFKKANPSGDGVLPVAEFKSILSKHRFPLDDEDFYHILSAFDVNLDGRISYVEFMKRTLGD